VKEDEMGRICITNEIKRNGYGILVRKPEGRKPLGTPRRRWEDNIKMDGWYGVIWLRIGTSGWLL
jgi:hypothetical protein